MINKYLSMVVFLFLACLMTGIIFLSPFLCSSAFSIDVISATCSLVDIQDAVNTVKAGGGGTVFIPAGNCIHTDMIRMPDGVNLVGEGETLTIINNARIIVNPLSYGKLDKPFRLTGFTLSGNSKLEIRA